MFKVKATLTEFQYDEDEHPCHFNYKVGDQIFFDGERFEGRICPNAMATLIPVMVNTYNIGYKTTEYIFFRYRGADTKDPDMVPYDGLGYRPKPLAPVDPNAPIDPTKKNPKNGFARGYHVVCGDTRTLAHFLVEPYDLADCDYAQPFYRRAILMLDRIAEQPGINRNDIIGTFTEWQVNGISPRLTPSLRDILLEALEDMGYIVIADDGSMTATGKEPPSRPVMPPEPEGWQAQ